jgi:putative ABC transport system permease protein
MVAVAALTYGLAHLTGIIGNLLDSYARLESGHVRIRHEGYTERERFLPVHLNMRRLSEMLEIVRGHPGVTEALPRIRLAALVDGASVNRPGLLLGVDLSREERYLGPQAMTASGRLPRAGSPEVLVGAEFAEKLGVGIGDTLTLLSQTAYRSLGGARLVVTGLASSGIPYLDNTFLIAPLDQAQSMVDLQDATTEIVVFADDHTHAQGLAEELRKALSPEFKEIEVLSWHDQGQLVRMLDMMQPILAVFFLILLTMACLVIVNTMLMTVMERMREYGMYAALGMRRRDIVKLILAEGSLIGLLGAVVGGVIGTLFAVWLEQTGISVAGAARAVDMPFQGRLYPDWRPTFALVTIASGVLAAALATLYPAWRAVRRSPAESLRA